MWEVDRQAGTCCSTRKKSGIVLQVQARRRNNDPTTPLTSHLPSPAHSGRGTVREQVMPCQADAQAHASDHLRWSLLAPHGFMFMRSQIRTRFRWFKAFLFFSAVYAYVVTFTLVLLVVEICISSTVVYRAIRGFVWGVVALFS